MNETPAPKLEALLDYIKRTRGFDFAAYKPSTVGRRIEKRMQALNIAEYAGYQDYLQVHPAEFTVLFNLILINVTEFFRDPPAWEHLASDIIPRLLEGKGRRDPIRVWSAGCASGEEAYSVTMLIGDALGLEGLRDRVRVYATDVDEEALSVARRGRYADEALEHIPRHLVEKYFVRAGAQWVVHEEARRSIIFGRHDLIQDPPISRLDLLLCRNTLMYFNHESQSRVLARFHFAINDGGYLFVGRAETLFTHAHLFTAADLKRRLFMKVPNAAFQERTSLLGQANSADDGNVRMPDRSIVDSGFDLAPSAQVLLDAAGKLIRANERARTLFRIGVKDQGRDVRDLDLPLEVLRIIDRTYSGSTATRMNETQLAEVEWTMPSGEPACYHAALRPRREGSGTVVGMSLVLEDITAYRGFEREVETVSAARPSSNEELETSNEALRSTVEELETTNEELRSTVEELETTNEELRSTVEELETMNEELQSTNEELHTINDELRQRRAEVAAANSFFGAVLGAIEAGLVVLDRNGHITAWNRAAEDLWGLRAHEVEGRSFFSLDIGLAAGQLGAGLRAALAGGERSINLQTVNRRGQPIFCEVRCGPLKLQTGEVDGAVLMVQVKEASA